MAVLPLVGRRWLDTTCLVFGAMAPDFQYFANGEEKGGFSHTLLGIPLWGLPVTLALAVVFHALVKWPLVAAAPAWLARRVAARAAMPWHLRAVPCVVSALIGVVTHIAWDGGTHAQGWAEHHFAHFVDHKVVVPVLGRIPVFRVFQHVSTVVGLAVLAIYLARWLRRQPAVDVPPPRGRATLLACVAAGIAAVGARAMYVIHAKDPGTFVVATISGILAGILAASVINADAGAALRRALAPADSGASSLSRR